MFVSERNTFGVSATIPSIDIGKYKNKILEYLNNLVNRVFSKKSNEYDSQYHSIIDTHKLHVEDEIYLHRVWVNSILERVDKLTIMLETEPLLKNEYFDFLAIKQICEYIITKDGYSKPTDQERDLIVKLFEAFVKIIQVKSDLFGDIDTKDEITDDMASSYAIEYESFSEEISEYMEKFYLDIYTPSGKHEESINELYAVMKE
ncbi:hypothetical protein [Methanobacterium formicicum]|uniref:Uncharacterized protein n=1 Tax=Methanobacterium formicicum TaxID=2162 RepID=A0A843AG20_METFO|nr:hypothetical protein [Methanobacterium formicicum]MBF4474512.1 hypothetical protein [Methanobacterium formicicum]